MLTVTAFNFGATQIDQTITLPKINPGPVVNMINEANAGELIPASCDPCSRQNLMSVRDRSTKRFGIRG